MYQAIVLSTFEDSLKHSHFSATIGTRVFLNQFVLVDCDILYRDIVRFLRTKPLDKFIKNHSIATLYIFSSSLIEVGNIDDFHELFESHLSIRDTSPILNLL